MKLIRVRRLPRRLAVPGARAEQSELIPPADPAVLAGADRVLQQIDEALRDTGLTKPLA